VAFWEYGLKEVAALFTQMGFGIYLRNKPDS
jgi:hypothetical protein